MNATTLRFAFVGDVCLSGIATPRGDAPAFDGWPDISTAVGKCDFLVGNLECCLVDDRCSERDKRQTMAIPAANAALLASIGFTDLALANNHMLDCGPDAITATHARLAQLGIRAQGAGADLAHAETATYVDHDGRRIALLGACDAHEYFAGASGRPGIAPLVRRRLGRRVRAAAATADLVMVVLHAGLEFSPVPSPWRRRLSRWLIEQGAHMVIQHHPHVWQGLETYRGGLIAYSLGNFIFKVCGNAYQDGRPGVLDSAVLVVDVDFGQGRPVLGHRLVPVRIGTDHYPKLMPGTAGAAAVEQIEGLSSALADPVRHRRLWLARCRAEAATRTRATYYHLARGELRGASRNIWRMLRNPADRRWIMSLLTLGRL